VARRLHAGGDRRKPTETIRMFQDFSVDRQFRSFLGTHAEAHGGIYVVTGASGDGVVDAHVYCLFRSSSYECAEKVAYLGAKMSGIEVAVADVSVAPAWVLAELSSAGTVIGDRRRRPRAKQP
jgi:hypothetical protein